MEHPRSGDDQCCSDAGGPRNPETERIINIIIILLLLYPTKMPAAMIIIRKDANPNQSVARDKI